MPRSIQRIRTDRGQELFAYRVRERLQKTALEEFSPTAGPADPELDGLAAAVRRPYGVYQIGAV